MRNVLIALGVLCILGAAGLTGYNILDSRRAEDASNRIVTALSEQMNPETELYDMQQDGVDDLSPESQYPEAYTVDPMLEQQADQDMPVMELDGYAYIGLLIIPSLDLKLPVMDRWDEERLRISSCVYEGSYLSNDLVICAHNYIGMFSDVRWIDIGADVYILTADGDYLHYIVTNLENLAATQVQDMTQNEHNSGISNKWDMTLFTCNTGGQTRRAIRCERLPAET